MKPLMRWTIGGVKSKLGWEVFSESLRLMPKVYPEFDFVICHNNLSHEEEEGLKGSGVFLHQQRKSELGFSVCWEEGKSVLGKSDVFVWKLVPPRLRLEAHELWVDNDIVIRNRIPEIDEWLNRDVGLISLGFYPNYGVFENQISPNLKSCAGLFGLPPNFDFSSKIQEYSGGRILQGYDEQGLVTLIVSEMDHVEVSIDHMRSLSPKRKLWGYPLGMRDWPIGMHFHHTNHSSWHRPWSTYKLLTIP